MFVALTPVWDGVVRLCIGKRKLVVGRTETDRSADLVALKTVLAGLTTPAMSTAADERFPLDALQRVSQIFLGSNSDCFDRTSPLIVAAPSALLSSLPMAVLIEPGSPRIEPNTPLGTVPWLGASHGLSTVVDAAHFIASRRMVTAHVFTKAFLGIGDPRLKGTLQSGETKVAAVMRGAKQGSVALTALDELPDTREELLQAVAALGESRSTLLR